MWCLILCCRLLLGGYSILFVVNIYRYSRYRLAQSAVKNGKPSIYVPDSINYRERRRRIERFVVIEYWTLLVTVEIKHPDSIFLCWKSTSAGRHICFEHCCLSTATAWNMNVCCSEVTTIFFQYCNMLQYYKEVMIIHEYRSLSLTYFVVIRIESYFRLKREIMNQRRRTPEKTLQLDTEIETARRDLFEITSTPSPKPNFSLSFK